MIRLRKLRRLTQSEMADSIGVGLRTYQKYEYGMTYPRPDKLPKIARALGVSESDLFRDPISTKAPETNLSKAELLGIATLGLAALDESQLRDVIDLINAFNGANATVTPTIKPMKIKG